MNKVAKEILHQLIHLRKFEGIHEFSCINLDEEIIVNEYSGMELRLFRRDGKVNLLCPSDMTVVQEGALAQAIESGAIFDDANRVERATKYVTQTTLPINAMASKSIEVPKGLPNMTAAVIGVMDNNGHCPCDQTDIDNGHQFVKDICTSKDSGNEVKDIVSNYLDMRDNTSLPTTMGQDILDVERSYQKVLDFDPDDVLDDDDYEEIGPDSVEECDTYEEGFFSALSTNTISKLIYHLNTVNDIINNPLLPNTAIAPNESLNVIDDCMTEGRVLSKMAEKVMNEGRFDNETMALLHTVHVACNEMSTAADVIANPWLKQEDLEDTEAGAKEAVQKWATNKSTLKTVIPRLINVMEDRQRKPITESFITKKPKKLKPIPARDIITYVTTEMNAIQDANDQSMLSGYCCSKLEIADFYISCLDNQDDRYIVPHNRQYLVNFENELNRLLTQILRIRPVNKNDRVWRVNVNYPENWRG